MKAKPPVASRNHASRWRVTFGLARYAFRATIRNKTSLFFGFIFPLVFVSIFGLLGNTGSKIDLGYIQTVDQQSPLYQAVSKIASSANAPINLEEIPADQVDQQLKQAKVDGILEPASGNPAGLELLTSSANPQGKASAEQFIAGMTGQLNLAALNQQNPGTSPPFSVPITEIGGTKYSYIDFVLPGQIGFSLLALTTFGIAFPLIAFRETLVLKRMFATTLKPIQFFLAQGISRSIIAVLQAAVIIGVGVLAFDYSLANGWVTFVQMLVVAFFGVAAFMGFGILIGNVAKDEESAPVALNLFNLPQFLLAGTFFPTDNFPAVIRAIGNNLPLAYLNDALRKLAVEGVSLVQVWPYLLGMAAWAAIAYFLAVRTFRAEP